MEVVEQCNIKHAYEFTNKLKDRIYTTVSEIYGASPLAIFDENYNPSIKFRLFYSKNKYEEKTVYLGDYIIFNTEENSIIEVLKPEEFFAKYAYIE